jgi:flavorubredoxin
MKMIAIAIVLILLLGLAIVTIFVESEADYKLDTLGGEGKARALILFHPSRDAHFSDELSISLADGLKSAGFSVHRATITRDTPDALKDYALIAVVSNTYWWTPDIPTLRYLKRARIDGVHAIGLIGGAGATGRSQKMLEEALRKTGANVIQTRSFWLFRPNDETRMNEPNREVATQMARQFGADSAQRVLALGKQQ